MMLSALAPLRRRLALALAPDLALEADTWEGPVPVFRSVRNRLLPVSVSHDRAEPTTRRRRNHSNTLYAAELRQLDRLFTQHTGVVLHWRTTPDYTGPMYQWPTTRVLVRDRFIKALLRVRAQPDCGVHSNTRFLAMNYFNAIWPTSAPWASDIPRPGANRGAA